MTSSQPCLYKSADLKINITVSFDPQDGFGHSKIHFGEVFQVQGAKGDRGQKVQRCQGTMVPRVPGFKRCQGYLGQKL